MSHGHDGKKLAVSMTVVLLCSSHEHTFSGIQRSHRQLFYELPHVHHADTTTLDTTIISQLLSDT